MITLISASSSSALRKDQQKPHCANQTGYGRKHTGYRKTPQNETTFTTFTNPPTFPHTIQQNPPLFPWAFTSCKQTPAALSSERSSLLRLEARFLSSSGRHARGLRPPSAFFLGGCSFISCTTSRNLGGLSIFFSGGSLLYHILGILGDYPNNRFAVLK